MIRDHGEVIELEHAGTIWKVTLARRRDPTYTVWLDPRGFLALYEGVTRRSFADDFLAGGEDEIRRHLLQAIVMTEVPD